MQLSEQLVKKFYSEYSCSLGYSFANSIRGGNKGTFSKAQDLKVTFFFFFLSNFLNKTICSGRTPVIQLVLLKDANRDWDD